MYILGNEELFMVSTITHTIPAKVVIYIPSSRSLVVWSGFSSGAMCSTEAKQKLNLITPPVVMTLGCKWQTWLDSHVEHCGFCASCTL